MKLLSITIALLLCGIASFSQTVTGAGTVNYVPKFTGTSVIGNSLIFDNGTNVGIGTASPTTKLQINGITSVIGGAGDEVVGSGKIQIVSGYASPVSGRIIIGDGTGWKMHFSYKNTSTLVDLLTLTDVGNVGIGTATPLAKLNVVGDAITTGHFIAGATNFINGNPLQVSGNASIYGNLDGVAQISNNNYAAYSYMNLPSNSQGWQFYSPNGAFNAGLLRFVIGTGADIASSALLNSNFGIGVATPASKLEILSGTGNENIRISGADGNGTRYLSSSSFDYPTLSYHAWINNAVGGTTGEISFLDRPGTSGYAPAVRTSDILFKTAHNWNNVSYGQYIDVTMAIKATQDGGYVGIGTTSPATKLDIVGNGATNVDFQTTGRARIKGTDAGVWLNDNSTDRAFIGISPTVSSHAMGVYVSGIGWNFNVMQNGNVLIGKTTQANSTYMLDVNGNARANKVTVNTTGADFVFEPGYQLPSLKEVENFVKANHHLQGIATAKKMQEEGVDLGDNQIKLLQKVEELTLYTIEQNKANSVLEQNLLAQDTEIKKLKEALSKLQALVEELRSK